MQMNLAEVGVHNYYEDFTRELRYDILIERINFTRATFKEAQEFKERIEMDILTNQLKIIIDLSNCEYIDSTFLGVLVVVLKKMAEKSGEIKYIIPKPSAQFLFKITGLYGVLNLYRTVEEAINSFE